MNEKIENQYLRPQTCSAFSGDGMGRDVIPIKEDMIWKKVKLEEATRVVYVSHFKNSKPNLFDELS